MYKILRKKIINESVEEMDILAPFVSEKCEPGQFIILRVDEKGERIPLTIADYDREEQSIKIVYQKVGHTTKLLGQKKAGEFIEDFAGPLGKEAPLNKAKRVIGVAGGVGAAPLYPQIKKLKAMGSQVDVIIGARNSEFIIFEEEFRKIADNLYFATDDGSKGKKGFVTDVLMELLEKGNEYDEAIAIGPVPMMRAVVGVTKKAEIATSVSLNPIMIDGTGMCGGCRVTIAGETKFACVDGPDFNGFDVDFEELINRQQHLKSEEKEIEEHHKCKIGLSGGYDD